MIFAFFIITMQVYYGKRKSESKGEKMNFKRKQIDMLHGPLAGKILFFTVPIALSSMLQQLFNAADTAVVGLFDGADALAAVGTNTEIVALIVSVSTGLSVGANLLVANRIGRGETGKILEGIHTSLLLALIIGIGASLLGQFSCKLLLSLIRTPASILKEADLYLRIYLLGYPFLLLYDFASAILRAQGDSRYPFVALTLSGILNVGLNILFVAVFGMGVAGVALSTVLSTALSAVLVLWHLARETKLRLQQIHFSSAAAAEILQTGIPAAIQGAVFCFANIFVQASVNSFGETAIAGSTIAMNFEYFTYYIITAFGQTATTFTGQNYGAGQRTRCMQILWVSLGLSALCSSIPIFTIVFFRDCFSGLFTSDAAVIKAASVRILCILLFEPLCNLYEIPAGCLRGLGHSLYPALATMTGTCALRVIWILTIFRSAPALPMLYHAFPISWIVTILLVIICCNCSFIDTPQQEGKRL